jgi:nucleoside-diphosphate-sugar epimerase
LRDVSFDHPAEGVERPLSMGSVPTPVRDASILVVGGAGYIGSMLSGRLVDAGYHVMVLDPLWYGDVALAPLVGRPNFELYVGDTRDDALTRALVDRVSKVVHLGEIVGDPACDLDPEVTESVNLAATARLARMSSDAGVGRFLYASSCSVYGATDEIVDESAEPKPVSLYGNLKVAAERAILGLASEQFHPTIFRLATVYGRSHRPRFDLVVNALAGRAVVDHRISVHGGGQWRPFVHVSDVAATLCEALELSTDRVSGEIFNLGSNDQNHTVLGVAEIVRAHVPGTEVEHAAVTDHRNYRVSFDKLADAFSFRPSRTVSEGVQEIAAAVESGSIPDISDPRLSNVRALVETDARVKLWRDRTDGDPTAPFRPRDRESVRRSAASPRVEITA